MSTLLGNSWLDWFFSGIAAACKIAAFPLQNWSQLGKFPRGLLIARLKAIYIRTKCSL